MVTLTSGERVVANGQHGVTHLASWGHQRRSGGSSVFSKAAIVACVAAMVAGATACTPLRDQALGACSSRAQPGVSRSADADRGHGRHRNHHGTAHRKGHEHTSRTVVGPTCNTVELVSPVDSTYRPDVAGASRADRDIARSLLQDVNRLCESTSAVDLMEDWSAGDTTPTKPTHYFNPDRRGSLGLDAANPRAVLVYRQRIGGVMVTGVPLPSLGSIPRPHTHDPTSAREMLHVYCARDLAEAFTPNRELGVLADTIALRHRVRPLVAHLEDPHLSEIVRRVRGYLGDELPRVDPRTIAPGLGDAVLRATREELRQALMLLSEAQLRRLSTLVRSHTDDATPD